LDRVPSGTYLMRLQPLKHVHAGPISEKRTRNVKARRLLAALPKVDA
jgi:hypothetical protein